MTSIHAKFNDIAMEFECDDRENITLKDETMRDWFASNAKNTTFNLTENKEGREVLQMRFKNPAEQALFILKWQ